MWAKNTSPNPNAIKDASKRRSYRPRARGWDSTNDWTGPNVVRWASVSFTISLNTARDASTQVPQAQSNLAGS